MRLVAAAAGPLCEQDPAEVRDLDRDGGADHGEELRVAHPDRIGTRPEHRNGPCGPSFEPTRPTAMAYPAAVAEVAHAAPKLEWDTPLYQQARTQLEHALELSEIPPMVATRLRHPERALILMLPVEMDDGSFRSFPAYRVQHSSVLGPTKGGIRYDEGVDLGECAALDIPAPDMATNEQTMAWMMDTYSMQMGHAVPEIVTGKPVSIGGSLFRHEATGAGVVMVIERACERLGLDLARLTCVVQGFGNVGGIAASELHDRGARVVAVSDISGGVYSSAGLDIPTLHAYVDEN